jgi:hypothetical protein
MVGGCSHAGVTYWCQSTTAATACRHYSSLWKTCELRKGLHAHVAVNQRLARKQHANILCHLLCWAYTCTYLPKGIVALPVPPSDPASSWNSVIFCPGSSTLPAMKLRATCLPAGGVQVTSCTLCTSCLSPRPCTRAGPGCMSRLVMTWRGRRWAGPLRGRAGREGAAGRGRMVGVGTPAVIVGAVLQSCPLPLPRLCRSPAVPQM